jgi:hypothetical protein
VANGLAVFFSEPAVNIGFVFKVGCLAAQANTEITHPAAQGAILTIAFRSGVGVMVEFGIGSAYQCRLLHQFVIFGIINNSRQFVQTADVVYPGKHGFFTAVV